MARAWTYCLIAAAIMTAFGEAGASAVPRSGAGVYNRPSALFPPADPVRGAALAQPCLACHGDAAIVVGQPAIHPPKLRYQRASTVFYALQDYRSGRRRSDVMGPLAKTLSDQAMRDLASYLTAGPNRRLGAASGGPQLANSWAHEKVEEVCGFCHGESGLGEMEGYPALAGQNSDYLEHALKAYRAGSRSNAVMRVFARELRPEDLARLAAYFAAQPGLEINR
jgi:cytochrome c553